MLFNPITYDQSPLRSGITQVLVIFFDRLEIKETIIQHCLFAAL